MAITINGNGSLTGITDYPNSSVGQILQVVTTDYTGLFSTASANTWTQVSGLDRSITLSSSSSKVLIICSLGWVSSSTTVGIALDFRRDGTKILQGLQDSNRIPATFKASTPNSASHASGITFTGIDSPGSSGTKTYQLWTRSQGGTQVYINRTANNDDSNDSYAARPASHMTLVEIA